VKKIIQFLFVSTRILIFICFATIYLIRGYITHLTEKNSFKRKKKYSKIVNWICRLCCQFFGVHVHIVNEPPKGSPGLIVGNHMGFIDILASGSVRPMLYVTSKEMHETPVLGLLTEMGGCIYVERRSRLGIQNELKHIIQALKEGLNVCLYPEATSTNGEQVLPFKRTLMTAAAHAQVPIYPYVINFKSVEGQPFSLKNRDSVCWYGDISFVTSMIAAFSLKYVEVEIEFLQPVYPKVEDDRALLADQLHSMISNKFKPATFSEKVMEL
jgi:1-acyl-sn-glycerol-3-phosphate acyltransferase